MAPHSSTLAWKIPWTEEPGRLQSMGSLAVRHDWATSLSLFTFMHWRRKWQPTCVLAWRTPRAGEPGGLPSLGSHRVGHDWSDSAAAAEVQMARLSWFGPCLSFQVYFVKFFPSLAVLVSWTPGAFLSYHLCCSFGLLPISLFKSIYFSFFIYLTAPSLSCSM